MPSNAKWFIGGVIAALAIGVPVTVFVAAGNDDPVAVAPTETPTPQVEETEADDPTPTPTPEPEPITSSSSLRLDGIGPIVVGMTPAEAEAAAGVEILVGDDVASPDCAFAEIVGGPIDLSFMVLDGVIVRVDIFERSPIRTLSGVGVRDFEQSVFDAYPGRIRDEPHPYTGPEGRYLIFEPKHDKDLSLIFETDGSRVTSFRSGFAGPVSYIEGCA